MNKKKKKRNKPLGKNIGILMPHNFGYFLKDFVISLSSLQGMYYQSKEKRKSVLKDTTLSLICNGGISIDNMRNKLVKNAFDSNIDVMLWLDTDMTFPPNMIEVMYQDLKDNPEFDAVTGVYTWKKPPYLPHVYAGYSKKKGGFIGAVSFPINSIFPVKGCGFGCVMIKTEVFKNMKEPYFSFEAGDDTNPRMGEDLYFCLKSKVKMLCDSRIRCGHLDMKSYGLDDYISHAGLEKTKDGWNITSEQVKEITDEHLKNK